MSLEEAPMENKEFAKAGKLMAGGFGCWFAFCAALSVAGLGLTAWAIIKLVNHFTAGG